MTHPSVITTCFNGKRYNWRLTSSCFVYLQDFLFSFYSFRIFGILSFYKVQGKSSSHQRPRPHVSVFVWKRWIFFSGFAIRWKRSPKTHLFKNASPSGDFRTVEKGGLWIRWCHKSYAVIITRALWGILSYFHRFSVFVWTGENHSNTLHVDAFSKIFGYLWMGPEWVIILESLWEEPLYSDYLLWHCWIFEICLKRICPLASSDSRFLHRLV